MTPKLLRILVTALAASVLFGCAQDPNTVRVAVGTYNLNNLPFFVAEARGYFAEEGLNVRIDNFAQGGSKALQALIGGSSDVAVGFYEHTIQMQSKYKEIVGFALLARNAGLVLAGRHGVQFDPARPETIRGMNVGITGSGSSSDFFMRYYLARNGLSPRDVALISVGSGASAALSLREGKIDLLVNYDPAATMLLEMGVGEILIDARTDAGANQAFGGVYPTSILYALPEFLERRPDAAEKMARGIVRALRFIQESSAEEIVAVLPESYITSDRETYVKAVASAKRIFSADGRFNREDLETPLRVLRKIAPNVAAMQIDLERTYTNRFVDRVLAARMAQRSAAPTLGEHVDSREIP